MSVGHTPPIMIHACWHVTVMTDLNLSHLGGLWGDTRQAQPGHLGAVRAVRATCPISATRQRAKLAGVSFSCLKCRSDAEQDVDEIDPSRGPGQCRRRLV